MKVATALCLIVVVAFAAVVKAEDAAPVELTASTFDAHIKNNDLTLVEFFAPWCGHCKSLKPEYEEAARRLAGKHKIATVDCTTEQDLCATYKIRGFPTLKLIRSDGTITDYEDARKADALVKFVLKQAAPAFIVAKDAAEVEAFKTAAGSDIKIVLSTASDSTAAAGEFKKAANALRNDVDFAIATGATADAVVMYRKFDEPVVNYNGEITSDAVVSWINSESLPLVGEIGPENYHKYVERELPLVWAFIDYHNAEQNKIPETLAPIAKEFRSKVLFVKIDGQRWGDHAKTFGLSGSLPGIVVEDRKNRKNYVFPEGTAPTEENLRAHIVAFTKGELTATIRSEEEPASNDGPVFVIVGKTWEKVVNDPTKDVFVEFYAPWCGHCKSLAPMYEELGKEFKSEPNVVIAKIDGTENDAPVDVQGFPTLFFYPANNKANPIPYNGERTTEAMAKFVRENSWVLKNKPASGDAKTEL